MGNALVAMLYASLRDLGVSIQFESRLERLIGTSAAITGAQFSRHGLCWTVRARKGVVLAGGGLGRNASLRRRHLPEGGRTHSLAAAEVEGDTLEAAMAIGARMSADEHLTPSFWSPVSRVPGMPGGGLFPHLLLDRAKPGLIAVDGSGGRFTDESRSYHDFVLAMLRTPLTQQRWYLVCDADFIRKYGLGYVHPGASLRPHLRNGYLQSGRSLADLARAISVDPVQLEAAVEQNNRAAASGVDEHHGKGTTTVGRFNGDPQHGPNPCIGPIRKAPFFAMQVFPADIAASAGLDTDAEARVLAEDGEPIPGLYACGNDMASVFRGTYPGPGTTLGPAMTFAYLAAQHIARRTS